MKLQSHIRKKRWNNDSTPQDQFLNYVCVCVCAHTFAQSCPTLCNPMDCSPPVSSVHEILQARILEWGSPSLFQGIFMTQGSNPSLLHRRQILYHLSYRESPKLKRRQINSYICHSIEKCFNVSIIPTIVSQGNFKKHSRGRLGKLLWCKSFMIFQVLLPVDLIFSLLMVSRSKNWLRL